MVSDIHSIRPIIRCITGFTRTDIEWSKNNLKKVLEDTANTVEEASDLLKSNGYKVWTKRISLPIPLITIYSKLSDILLDIVPDNYLVSTGCLFLEEVNIDRIVDIVSQGIYICLIWGKEPDAIKAANIFMKASMHDPINATKIALSLTGTPLETPYYPLSTSLYGEGIGIALLYPNLLEQVFVKRGLKGIKKCLISIEKDLLSIFSEFNNRYFVDYSISPWMENSVVELIESITGYSPDRPGFLHGIYLLNNILKEFMSISKLMQGYNEVMLPYAEDKLLIHYGMEGKISAKDFLRFSSICVSGPDMIVIPNNRSKLIGYIRDSLALGRSKGKPMGLRIIPVDNKVGDKIVLGKFSEVYVIDY